MAKKGPQRTKVAPKAKANTGKAPKGYVDKASLMASGISAKTSSKKPPMNLTPTPTPSPSKKRRSK